MRNKTGQKNNSKKKSNLSSGKIRSKKKNTSGKNKLKQDKLKTEIQQPWYIWLKNNIIENEEKLSKKDRHRRLIISLFAVFCFFSVLFSTFIIDFSISNKRKEIPYFTITKREKYKQLTAYYGMFYKAWKCDNGDTSINFGRLRDKMDNCLIDVNYDDEGFFTNPNKVKMTESQINIIKTYYFDKYINFKSKEELENAYKLSKAINKVLWINANKNEIINNDEAVILAIFGKEEIKDGIESFSLQYDDTRYHKCLKNVGGEYLISNYIYSSNLCENTWENLKLSKDICELAKESTTFIKNLAPIIDYCK